jgi:23S rRNA (cytosine1962-C5)-methyltransferase
MPAKVILSPEKSAPFKHGHPWIYPKSIVSQEDCQTGELVQVWDKHDQHIATGIYNAHSLYRVRILAYAHDPVQHDSLESILLYRLHQAIRLREMLALKEKQTTAYRLFNSEAEGLSGLTIDRFNQILVVSSSALWVEKHRELIIACIKQSIHHAEIFWFPQTQALKQEGLSVEAASIERTEIVLESGLKFSVNFSHAQKTGLFLDQRDNHQRIAQLARGKRVLDLYTYTGGFGLHAAQAGAAQVTAIDSSASAIHQAQENAKLNNLTQIDFIKEDARTYLEKAGEYDIVILDPPKLVPSKKHLNAAKNYYRFLHREVFKVMKPGSLLMTCNCSSAMDASEFNILIHTQARMVNRTARTLGIYGPSLCHPTLASFPEGNYLCAILLAIL